MQYCEFMSTRFDTRFVPYAQLNIWVQGVPQFFFFNFSKRPFFFGQKKEKTIFAKKLAKISFFWPFFAEKRNSGFFKVPLVVYFWHLVWSVGGRNCNTFVQLRVRYVMFLSLFSNYDPSFDPPL